MKKEELTQKQINRRDLVDGAVLIIIAKKGKTMKGELTQKQINRQDLVDGAIFELLEQLAPNGAQLQWNIEHIGAVRDAVLNVLVDNCKVMSEMDFYPYISESDDN